MGKILITGGAGFVGHHFVEHFLKNTDLDIVVWDKLSYSGKLDRLRDINAFDDKRVLTLTTDFSQPISEGVKRETGDVEYIIHMGAESHVDRSIADPLPFIQSNVVGTHYMLDYARSLDSLKQFYFFSTDEVHGPAPVGTDYRETDRQAPTNPYAASKAAAENLVMAYRHTYRMKCSITRSMNIYGERQHPEKFIPLCIRKILNGERVIIHSDRQKKNPGSRKWIHARNVADAYSHIMQKCPSGHDWNIVGEELNNLQLAQMIADILGKELRYSLIDFHSSRPGHDLRYSLSGEKLKQWGWKPPKSLRESLEKTVRWTLENPKWLEA